MGQSVEWGKLPFEFDRAEQSSIVTNMQSSPHRKITKPHKMADTTFRRNANLYSSIMGKSTRNSIRASTMETVAT